MSWSIGYDTKWKRDIGYGVPAFCDHPGCNEKIDRGLAFVCGGQPYGGERGCGLYFCSKHLYFGGKRWPQLCDRCCAPKPRKPFPPKPDHPEWIQFKMTDESWAKCRKQQIIHEIYVAVERLGASMELLATIGSWGDTMDDEDVLEWMKKINSSEHSDKDPLSTSTKTDYFKTPQKNRGETRPKQSQ